MMIILIIPLLYCKGMGNCQGHIESNNEKTQEIEMKIDSIEFVSKKEREERSEKLTDVSDSLLFATLTITRDKKDKNDYYESKQNAAEELLKRKAGLPTGEFYSILDSLIKEEKFLKNKTSSYVSPSLDYVLKVIEKNSEYENKYLCSELIYKKYKGSKTIKIVLEALFGEMTREYLIDTLLSELRANAKKSYMRYVLEDYLFILDELPFK